MVGFSWKISTAVGGAPSVETNMNRERPTGYWWCKQVPVQVRQRCSKRMRQQKRNYGGPNHCAPEVGHLKEGTRSFEVRRPKLEEGCSEVSIREGPEELTLRAERLAQKACINVDNIAEDRWGPPLVDTDWHALCQTIYKRIEGSAWRELYDYCKEMSRAARAK